MIDHAALSIVYTFSRLAFPLPTHKITNLPLLGNVGFAL